MRALTTRFLPMIVALLGAIALVPSAASASTWFGSSLNHDPANAGASCNPDDTVPAPNCTHIGSYYPGTSGRVTAPKNGTIVRIRVLAQGPMTMKFKLVRVRGLSPNNTQGQAKVVKVGPILNVSGPTQAQLDNGTYPIQSFGVHVKVHRGDELAIDTNNNQAEYCSDGTPGQLTFYNPFLQSGQGFRSSTGTDDCLLLVQAVVKR